MAGGKKKAKPKVPTRPAVTHAGKRIEIPLLSGPVGPVVPSLQTKYPKWNEAADIEIVSYYFSILADAEVIEQEDGKRGPGAGSIQKAADAAKDWSANLNGAIAKFQRAFGVKDATESANGILLPDGETLKTLVDYGDTAEKLLELSWQKKDPKNYLFVGHFDLDVFVEGYKKEFGKEARYDAAKEPKLRQLLTFMMRDPHMVDIRWVAYVLATAYWEVSYPEKVDTGKINKKTKKPILQTIWRAQWNPVEESGHGGQRAYVRPVKVERQVDGSAKVIEYDGDTFTVGVDGKHKAVTKNAAVGASFAGAESKAYKASTGDEHSYYGRGYVQLTWWNNYATAGVNIGRGLDLLFDPELALDPETAYKLMSYSLLTGAGFANGRKLTNYLFGGTTDYVSARKMVNGSDHAADIAAIAKRFEALLLAARV